MQNAIKPRLAPGEIASLVHKGLAKQRGTIIAMTEFTDGYFNAVHGVRLADGRELVLKVAPPAGPRLLRHESDLIRAEMHFYERAITVGVPLPALRYGDPDSGVLLMDMLRGQTLDSVRDKLPTEDLFAIRRQLGEIAARSTGLTGPLFGYPRRDGRTRSPSWRAAFLAMIDDILLDAIEFDAELPLPAEQIAALVAKHSLLLDEVTTPSLVHFDLWDGNIFVIDNGWGWRVEAIIDAGRALYADPLAELVPTIAFAAPDQADIVIDAMLGRELTPAEQTRLCLYTSYLLMVLVTEGASQRFDKAEFEPKRQWFYQQLTGYLAQL
ncbi:aminoglycoside phosphotransferase (APT) family kinase protein [Allocatelliglobosispora scoriae]|uniref:Aminoglycoside phosphotransferase (APT) family kinase protein n=1 Tax=Allocatelliglobosispora scoriae TaxID=643052 RepID=A0A841BJ40_9ACTN|nr:aminoglycoside phosphotransferase family protein [Allocatelliglobosispora scoriae]MBB5867216.1 aminoglycoside phosphotransferase (APT) family kinase protein [Allocatelliglobosispora scoriae]